jgi:hypothetical protein
VTNYRPTFPHTLSDISRSIDGGLGIVVGDLADGSIWVLKRNRKTQDFTLTHYDSPQRGQRLEQKQFSERQEAIDAMAKAIGLVA